MGSPSGGCMSFYSTLKKSLAKNSGGLFYLFDHIEHISAQARKKAREGNFIYLALFIHGADSKSFT